MKKQKLIKEIKKILKEWGSFGVGELDYGNSVVVNEMGDLMALGEYFNYHTIDVRVYNSNNFDSDSIEEYEVSYEELPKSALEEILMLAEQYEVEQMKTKKRISN